MVFWYDGSASGLGFQERSWNENEVSFDGLSGSWRGSVILVVGDR